MDVIDKELKRKQAITMQKALSSGLLDPKVIAEAISIAKAEILTDISQLEWDAIVSEVEEALDKAGVK